MSEFTSKVIIDGEEYTAKQLARYQYSRTLHVLQEMNQLGVQFYDGAQLLTATDLNWLEPKKAEQILLDKKESLSEQEMLDIFAAPRLDAERRWKEYAKDYDPKQSHMGITEVFINGVNIPETMAILGGASNKKQALATFPDHFIVIGDITTGQRGMESFGMFGEPVYIHGISSKQIPAELPIEKDDTYPIQIFGEMLLKSDNTPIHVGAYHMFCPTEDGFKLKSTFFCPSKAPAAIAWGHQLHFAIEIVNSASLAYENKTK